MKPNRQLPPPSDEAMDISHELSQKIRTYIKRHGTIPFSRFMELALYTPGLGYYAGDLPKIGRTGDFTTAPEISPIFSRCLARQAAQGLQLLDTKNLVEFGAGRGIMARDVIQELEDQQTEWHRYYIIELSADLRHQQEETLSQLPDNLRSKIVWLERLPTQPMEAVILANEVLDAMPFERLKLEPHEASLAKVRVNPETDQFEWFYERITDQRIQRMVNGILHMIGEPKEQGYFTEINLHIEPWLKSISDWLSKGLILLVDYGYSRREYYQPARRMGTLRCHYQHLAHDNPFFYPGLQDITAHVDFTNVAEAGFDAGFKIAGFTTQANFLMGSGLMEMSADPQLEITESIKIAQQIKTLTLPDEMGETFKTMALTKHLDAPLIGFSVRDLRHTL